MDGRCSGITREGTRCTRSAEGPNGLCWLHDPTRQEDRKRAASKAGSTRPNREAAELRAQLRALYTDVLEGRVDKSTGAVLAQIAQARTRLLATESKIREVEELEQRVAALEERRVAS